MEFWSVIQGPHLEHEAGSFPDGKVIGTVVCSCTQTLARLYDIPSGTALHSFQPGLSPANMSSRLAGFTCVAHLAREPVNEAHHEVIADDASTGLACRRGHPSTITAGECRQMIDRYRRIGRKVRHVARSAGPDPTSPAS